MSIIIGVELKLKSPLFGGMPLLKWALSANAPYKAKVFCNTYRGLTKDELIPDRARKNLVDALMDHASQLCDPKRPSSKLLRNMALIVENDLRGESAVSFH